MHPSDRNTDKPMRPVRASLPPHPINWSDPPKMFDPAAPVWAHLASTARSRITTPQRATLLRPFLPYCLHRTALPDWRCVVSRNYHALGCVGWTDYEAATGWHFSEARARELCAEKVIDVSGYLFNDGSAPWHSRALLAAYSLKLDALIAPYVPSARLPRTDSARAAQP
jgi:hypothetical protein